MTEEEASYSIAPTALTGITPNGSHAEAPEPSITRLCVLDALFDATGTVRLKVTRRGREETLELPIRSVDNELVDSMTRSLRPKCPTYRDQINGQWKTVRNEADQDYVDKLAEYNRAQSYTLVCLGLCVDIEDEQQRVVWSADNRVHDLPATRAALKRIGFTDNHLIATIRAIQDLTRFVEETQASE
jgi:hypothetical protein